MKKKFFVTFICLFFLLISACNSDTNTSGNNTTENDEETSSSTTSWSIGTSSSNSAPYAIGGAISKTINDSQSELQLSPQVTGGFVENLQLVKQQEIDLGLNEIGMLRDSYLGKGDFEGEDFSMLRALFNVAFYPVHIVVLEDSNINSAEDLIDKKFSIAQPSQSTRQLALAYLEAYGLSVDDINAQELSTSEALTALKNKQIDGAIISSPLPLGGIIELATTHAIKLIPIEGPEADKFNELFGKVLAKSVIPAGTYPGVDYDVPTMAASSLIFTHKDMDENAIYELTKTFFVNIENYYENYPGGADLTLENALERITDIPIHTGAEKYFTENK